MTQEFYVDPAGGYLGPFDNGGTDARPPWADALRVPSSPPSADHGWDAASNAWLAPPEQTDAEKAATLILAASEFWIALQRALIDKGALTFADDVQAHVLAAIAAGAASDTPHAEAGLSPDTAMAARILVRTAVTIHRSDPARPGLLDRVGALLGLTPGEIDRLFIKAAAGGTALEPDA